MKHTKGTWEPFSYHNLEEGVRYGVSSSNGKYIGEEMTEGDANLIASAPEMLAMLKELHDNDDIEVSYLTNLWDENKGILQFIGAVKF